MQGWSDRDGDGVSLQTKVVASKWHTVGWSLTKREGVGVNIVFFCSLANLFLPGTKRSKSLTLNVGVFEHRPHLHEMVFSYHSMFPLCSCSVPVPFLVLHDVCWFLVYSLYHGVRFLVIPYFGFPHNISKYSFLVMEGIATLATLPPDLCPHDKCQGKG